MFWGYETGKYQGPVPAAQYPAEIEQASRALATVLTNAGLAASSVETSDALSRRVPTFTHGFADDDAPWFREFSRPYPMGAYHAAELPHLFDVNYTEPLTGL